MDDIQLIQFLANALKSATQQRDWVQVRNVDKQIASLLSSLSGQPLSEQKRQALMMLKDTHHHVNEICRQQSAELEHKMALHRNNREGAMAYAIFSGDEDSE